MTRNRFYIAVCLAGALVLQLGAAPGMAAQNSGGGGNQYTLSQDLYRQVERVQKLMGNNKYNEAIKLGKSLLTRAKRESDYSDALVSLLIAGSYMAQQKYKEAEPYLKHIVDLDALQPSQQTGAVQNLAGVYLSQQNYKGSINLYQQVLSQDQKRKVAPSPATYFNLGLAYSYRANAANSESDYKEARHYVKEAIQKQSDLHKKQPKKHDAPKKDWYESLFVINYKMQDYHQALDVAKFLVSHWPNKKDYWTYYANTATLLHKDRDATAIYGLMYKRDLFKKPDDYLQYASLLQEQHAPYKAAEVISKGIDKGIIPKTKDNYEQLSGLWIASREWNKALDVLGKEAQLSKTGKVYLRQAQIYIQRRDFNKARQAAENALNKGGMSQHDQGRTLVTLGQAEYELKNDGKAIDAFKKAEKIKQVRKDARNWLKYVAQNRNNGG